MTSLPLGASTIAATLLSSALGAQLSRLPLAAETAARRLRATPLTVVKLPPK